MSSAWPQLRKLDLTIGRIFGEGGDTWRIAVPSGNGVGAAVAFTPTTEWRGYLVASVPPREGTALPQVAAPTNAYTATGDEPLTPGVQLWNATGQRYAIGARLPTEGYYQYAARRLPDVNPLPVVPLVPGMGAALSHTWTGDPYAV